MKSFSCYLVLTVFCLALIYVCLASAASLNTDNDGEERVVRAKRQTARICRWLGDHIGYRCDGPAERAVWRTINRMRGVTDCNSMCRSQGRRGGRCVGGNPDRSTWCPAGQRCSCY